MRDIWEIVQNNNWSELPVFKARETKNEHLQMARDEVSKWSPAERRMFGSDPLEPEKKPMTPQEALLLSAGRELDEFIAVNVMGGPPNTFWQYSCNLQQAFGIEEKLFERGWELELQRIAEMWHANFRERKQAKWLNIPWGDAQTVPLAICRAAIQVLIYEAEHD